MWSLKGVIARCSILGTVIGILPGAGATIASFLCYSEEQKISKHPEKFGTGCLEGIAAPESGNNAATGGSMVPLLSLGIPGGNAAAIMMSSRALPWAPCCWSISPSSCRPHLLPCLSLTSSWSLQP